jgi:predicted RNase H-like HicB family nuclease
MRATEKVTITIELDREDDGRWIAEVRELPGALVYGDDMAHAIAKAKLLALQILASEIEHGERAAASLESITFTAAA